MNASKPAPQRLPSVIPPPPAVPQSVQSYYLSPGQLFASREPTSVTTIVGSCVAICLWDPVVRAGGINHYLLPRCSKAEVAPGRFGNTAFRVLLERLVTLGAAPRWLEARMFGGACLISAFRDREGHLGQQNVTMGIELLRSAKIRLVQQDVGGSQGRRIVFRTDDGSAVVQPL